MLPLIIKEYEPPCRRLRIRSKVRLCVALLIVLCAVSLIFIHRPAESQTTYRPFTVGYGDTYWDIAKQLQETGYKPKADIRAVVDELVRESGIPAHELQEGDTIMVPEMGADLVAQ